METKTAYSIGIPEIDVQHKQLFDCIDQRYADFLLGTGGVTSAGPAP